MRRSERRIFHLSFLFSFFILVVRVRVISWICFIQPGERFPEVTRSNATKVQQMTNDQ